jgi:hypothetical protein
MFPPRGKLLFAQLILLALRLPVVLVQVCSPGARFKGFLIDVLAVVGFLLPSLTHDCSLLECERA